MGHPPLRWADGVRLNDIPSVVRHLLGLAHPRRWPLHGDLLVILANPVRGTVYDKRGDRPKGSRAFWMTQEFGCTGFSWEPPKGDCAHFHRGVDFANGAYGRAVLAAAGGTVRVSQRESNGEHIVAIHHGGGVVSYYGHLQSRTVAAGRRVAKGDKIGEVGSSGNSTGPHLHFALKRDVNTATNLYPDSNGKWINPWPLLAQNVTVHPIGEAGVNIRETAGAGSTPGPKYAVTLPDLHIARISDGADLGLVTTARKWGGTVSGAEWKVDGVTGNKWERIWLGGAWRFIASPLAVRSAD